MRVAALLCCYNRSKCTKYETFVLLCVWSLYCAVTTAVNVQNMKSLHFLLCVWQLYCVVTIAVNVQNMKPLSYCACGRSIVLLQPQ